MKTSTEPQPRLTGVTHRMINNRGLRMHVAEAGEGPPLLLLHGVPQHWWEWRKVIGPLAETYRVICPDLRGSGWTEAPRAGYGRDQQTADIAGLMDTLELNRAGVISHDAAALAAYHLSLLHPDRISAHLALSIPPPYFDPDSRFVLALVRYGWHNILTVPVLGPALMGARNRATLRHMLLRFSAEDSMTEEDVEIFADRFQDPDRARAVSAIYRHFIHPEAVRILRGAYRDTRLTTPTRVLMGADDPNMQAGFIHGYAEYCDDLEVEYLPGANHFVAEDRPDAVVAAARKLFG